MKNIIDYKCKHCNKGAGKHQAKTLCCPAPGRGAFVGFLKSTYEADNTKPIYGHGFIL